MEALAGAAVGALLALVGGVVVRRWEARRAARADIYVNRLAPASRTWWTLSDEAAQGTAAWSAGANAMVLDLASATAAASPADYRYGQRVALHAGELHGRYMVAAGPKGIISNQSVRALHSEVLAVCEVLEEYDSFLCERLVSSPLTIAWRSLTGRWTAHRVTGQASGRP